jgi:hypothetical protein
VLVIVEELRLAALLLCLVPAVKQLLEEGVS